MVNGQHFSDAAAICCRKPLASILEFCRLFRTAGSIAGTVDAHGAGELAAVDNQIFVTDRSALEPAFQNLASASSVTGLRGKSSGNMRCHAVMGHGCARDDPAVPAAETKRLRRTRQAARFPRLLRLRLYRKSCREPY